MKASTALLHGGASLGVLQDSKGCHHHQHSVGRLHWSQLVSSLLFLSQPEIRHLCPSWRGSPHLVQNQVASLCLLHSCQVAGTHHFLPSHQVAGAPHLLQNRKLVFCFFHLWVKYSLLAVHSQPFVCICVLTSQTPF